MLTSLYSAGLLLIAVIVLLLALFRSALPRFHFSDLWTWRGTVGRGTYAIVGFVGFAIKHNIDRAVATLVFDRPFVVFNYWVPISALRLSSISNDDAVFLRAMLAVSLPFIWIGIGMSMRRLRSAGMPLWLVFLFFIPAINLVFFLILALIPESSERDRRVPVVQSGRSLLPDGVFGSAAIAAITGVGGAVLVFLGMKTFGVYGVGVFVALPFCIGLASVMIHSYRRPRSLGSCILVSLTAVGLAASGLLAFAVEGLICIAMAAPIVVPLALLGGIVGYFVQRGKATSAEAHSMMLLALAMPLGFMGLDKANLVQPDLMTVETTIHIQASAERIWPNVIAFPDLPQSRRWLFRLGVSHPVRANIQGTGVGAIRECTFSTGEFLERIDGWEENRFMAFSVISGAETMKELSPYDIHPAHLKGYMVPERAEFRLIPKPDGSTDLVGKSWYRNAMWPAAYWRLWSDLILHDIHEEVFEHIKVLSEKE